MVNWPRNCIGCGTPDVHKTVKLRFDESEKVERKEAFVTWITHYSFREQGDLYLCKRCWSFAEAEQKAMKKSAQLAFLTSLLLAMVLASITIEAFEVVDLPILLIILLQLAWVPFWSATNVLKFKNKYPFDSYYSIDPKAIAAPISFRNKTYSEMFSVATPYGSRYDPSIRLAKRTSKESLLNADLCLLGIIPSFGCVVIFAFFSALLSEPSLLLPGLMSGILFFYTILVSRGFAATARRNLPVYPGQNK
jgi:hypothetical protein